MSTSPPSHWARGRAFLARPLVRQLAQVLGGNLAGNALNLLGGVLVGWALGKQLFGLYGVLQGAMMLIAQLTDFGLNTTIVKYYRELQTEGEPDRAEALLRRTLWWRIGLVVLVVGGAALAAGPITRHLLDEPGAAGLFRLACLGALGSSVWMFCQAAMQARGQFGWYGSLTTVNHLVRLVLLGVLWQAGRLDLSSAMVVLISVPFIGSLSASMIWPRAFWRATMPETELRRRTREIAHFSKWIFFSAIITSLIMQTDRFLLLPLAGRGETGVFQMANYVAQGFPLLTAAVSTVFLPRLVTTRRRSEMLRITGYFIKATPLLIVATGVTIAAAHWLFPYIRNGEYVPSIPVFDLLVVAFTISMVVNPLSFFCLAFNRVHWLTGMNLAQLVLNALIDVALIPHYGALAAGISTLAIRLLALGLLVIAFRHLLALAEDDRPAAPAQL